MEVSEEDLQGLYAWVDEIPLSRPKRNIARDFADGVLLAEVVANYFPKLVELHNYSSANGLQQKLYNWNTLNQKVLKKLGMPLSKQHIQDIANGVPGAIERALKLAKGKIATYTEDNMCSTPVKAGPHGTLLAPGSLSPSPFAQPVAMSSPGISSKASPVQQQKQKQIGVSSEGLAADPELTIKELKETNEILETKARKLEQLVKLKDAKIQTLIAKLQAAGLA